MSIRASRAGLTATPITRYADPCGAEGAHLLLLERNPHVPWEQKLYHSEHHHTQAKQ
ncbi:hypothetical protein Cenrod_0754 [Candidatus Symbiobacter mobilis CR]|uniref:Uncharacterized protein n=1 Tax=Candidatus Symbiobacter mobilis CR TaxID=946483 RepID=U5N6H1_9BURK|nr:hypothetical protein Cenrod_0754 [Candidatus Symbiobacter mobilis CR]